MIEFFNRLFGRQTSGATAKERLRLVLMSDHLSLAPEMIDAMKRDFVDVISRYVEVDRDKIDVHFEHQDKALAMLANIPILAVTRTNGNGTSNGTESNGTNATNGANGTANGANDTANGASNGQAEPATSHPEPVEGRLTDSEATPSAQPQRKRRRKKSGANAPRQMSPSPAAPAT